MRDDVPPTAPDAPVPPTAPDAPVGHHEDTEPPHRERLPFAPERSAATAHLPEGPASRAWRLLDRAILVAVFVGLLVPGAMLAAGIKARPIENRPLAKLPPVEVATVLDGTWFEGVDAFLVDHVWVRRYAVRLRAEAYLRTGGTGSPQVIRGLDGWLFPRNSLEPTCRHTAVEMASALEDAAASFEAAGVTFRFVGIPDKSTVYPEQLGGNPFPPPCTQLEREGFRAALAALGGGAGGVSGGGAGGGSGGGVGGGSSAGVDGWSVLAAAKAADPGTPLYYRGDTHWTPYGALQVVRALITSIDPALWDESDVRTSGLKPRTIDLAHLLGAHRVERTARVVIRPDVHPTRVDVPVSVPLQNAPSIFRTTVANGSSDLPTVGRRTLILYDSYFGIDVGIVAPFFADATWVHVGDMQRHPELATLLGPFDTVVVERVERFLYGDDLRAMFSQLPN